MSDEPSLFGELPIQLRKTGPNFQSLQHPLWSEGKAKLIQSYLQLFAYITKHGNYIDGFAAPQRRDMIDLCSAKLVLESQPAWFRNFWLCDLDADGVKILEQIAEPHRSKKRKIEVIQGDFNQTVATVLASTLITTKSATFALIDQRTFECAWSTVERLAGHKSKLGQSDTKIELFYFLASGWLDRSIAAVKREETAAKLDRWWGRSDWRNLLGMQGIHRANLLASRFVNELGYRSARPYAIHSRVRGGRTMYHMIHATGHDDAPPLMLRAYRKISGHADVDLSSARSIWRNFGNRRVVVKADDKCHKVSHPVKEVGNTIPYPPLNDKIRSNAGFTDLRRHPELVSQIPEAMSSSGLKLLLTELADINSQIMSLGCDLGQHIESDQPPNRRHSAGGYVQIVPLPLGPTDKNRLLAIANAIEQQLSRDVGGNFWELQFELANTEIKLGPVVETHSMWLWFHVHAFTVEHAKQSREALLKSLAQGLMSVRI